MAKKVIPRKKTTAKKKLSKAIVQAAYEPKLTNTGNYALTGKSPGKAKAFAKGVKKGLKNVKTKIATKRKTKR